VELFAYLLGNALFIPGSLVMIFAHDFYTGLLGTVLIVPGLAIYMLLPLPMLSEIISTILLLKYPLGRQTAKNIASTA